MLRSLELHNFKNFRNAKLELGPLTILVGANASGKSNIRDAFRFLHGVARGYALAEIIGEKWVEGGVLQWRGIRGATREVCFAEENIFSLTADFDAPSQYWPGRTGQYYIKIMLGDKLALPRLKAERLNIGQGEPVFDSHPSANDPVAQQNEPNHLAVRLRKGGTQRKFGQRLNLLDFKPALSQLSEHPKLELRKNRDDVRVALRAFESMRFLDLAPDAMRSPSVPGQAILGDRGENLSSVLQEICEDPQNKSTLLEWIAELTPMDVADFEFPADQAGRILVTLIEHSGQRVSAHSASDGTLRFLAMIAALLGPQPANFYFFEEIDNGIHPSRLHLLLQLIEQQVAKGEIQIVATSHSPDLLGLLSETSIQHASVIYRLPGHQEGGIRRIVDIPNARAVLQRQDIGRLHASGWLEDAVAFEAPEGDLE